MQITLEIPDDPWYEERMLSIARDMNLRYKEKKERETSSLSSFSPTPPYLSLISKEKEIKEIPYTQLSSSNISLPIPKISTVIKYVKWREWQYQFDAHAFYDYMEKHEWKDSKGEYIQNWAKVLDSSFSKGKFKGRTVIEEEREPRELPYSLYGLKGYKV